MRKRISTILIVVMLTTLLVAWHSPQEKKLPSAVQKDINQEFRAYRQGLSDDQKLTAEQWYAKRAEFTRKHMANVKTDGLDRKETYEQANLYSWAQMNDKAKEIFAGLAKGDDIHARNASKQLISMAIENDTTKARAMLTSFRNRFAPTFEDSFGLYGQVTGLARQLKEEGNEQEAFSVIKDEIAYLNFDKPYWAWRIVVAASDYMEKDEALAMLDKYREKFEGIAEKRKATLPVADSEKEAYERETSQWEAMAKSMLSRQNRLTVMDGPAPDFTFTHFFNTEPLEFSKMRGKVVVIDFWATWCGPCIATFPELRKMYDKYKGTDVQILGVTGFQGSMSNHGEARVQNLSEEQELELMPTFIKHQNVTWPIVFSDRNAGDIEYGIQGIPTMVVIDKQGIVRMFEHPMNKDKIIELIEKLRAE